MAVRGERLRAWHEARRKVAADSTVAASDTVTPVLPASAPALSLMRPLTPRQVAARLAALNCDPLAIMAKLAKNPHLDPNLRVALARHLAAYQIEQTPQLNDDKGLPALGDVIAAAWRRPKAAAQFTAESKAKAAVAARKRKKTGQ